MHCTAVVVFVCGFLSSLDFAVVVVVVDTNNNIFAGLTVSRGRDWQQGTRNLSKLLFFHGFS